MKHKILLLSHGIVAGVLFSSAIFAAPLFNINAVDVHYHLAGGSSTDTFNVSLDGTATKPVIISWAGLQPNAQTTVTTTTGTTISRALGFLTPANYTGSAALTYTATMNKETIKAKSFQIQFVSGKIQPIAEGQSTETTVDDLTCGYSILAATSSSLATIDIDCGTL